MRVLALLPAAVAGVTLFNNGNIDGMREVFTNIAKKAAESGEKISQDTKDIVREMLDTINSTLVPALIKDKKSAQNLHDIAYNGVEDCYTNRKNTFDGDIASKEQSMDTAEDLFHNCKGVSDDPALLQQIRAKHANNTVPDAGAEGHDYGYDFDRQWNDEGTAHALGNTSHETHAAEDFKTKCDALDNYVKTFNPKIQKNDWCEDPAEGADWSDIFRTNGDMVDKSHEWFHYMDTFTKNHAAEYKRLREECHEARHRHQKRVAECHKLQHDFESASCAHANAIDETCHYYDTCWDNTYAAYVKQNESVAAMEVQFKAQQHALECLLCYGDQILQDSTDLSACDDAPCENCDSLCLTYTDPHEKVPCDEEIAHRPCDDEWNMAHYAEYTKENCIPVDTCIPCSGPALVAHSMPEED